MSTRKTWLAALAALVMLLSGCTKEHFIELWNNTGGKVVLVVGSERVTVESGAKCTVHLLREGEGFTLIGSEATNTFTFHAPPDIFLAETRTTRRYKLQANKDGLIYVLQPNAIGVVQSVGEQPLGFPLRPAQP